MKAPTVIIILGVLAFMQRCSGPMQTAGGTTSTESAKIIGAVVSAQGKPVPGAIVRCRPADYLSSDGSVTLPPDGHTDGAGGFSVDSIGDGGYLIEVFDSQGMAAAIACSVSGDFPVDVGTHTVVSMGAIEGTAGGPGIAAYIRVRGLERYVTADADGRFSVAVPSGLNYHVTMSTRDTSVDFPLTQPVEPACHVNVSADLGTYRTDSAAMRAFLDRIGFAAAPLDSMAGKDSGGRIRALSLHNRKLASLPASVGNLAFLWELDLGGNPLDSLPETLAKMPLLAHLFLDATPLRELPGVVCRCAGLRWLTLNQTGIRTLPSELSSLTSLHVLEMRDDSLTDVPPVVWSLPSLTELALARNQLTSLPESIAGCSKLEILHLDENKLESLPAAITALGNLRIIYAYRNNLVALPESIGNLSALERLEVEFNGMTSLPPSIGKCTNLKYLNLWDNELTDLPESILSVRPSEGLALGNNRLCNLPSDIAAWVDAYEKSAWRGNQLCQ
jgi:hypothetical protein